MPTPPEPTRLSLEQRLGEHALRTTWPQLTRLHVRHSGAFAQRPARPADVPQAAATIKATVR